MLALVVGGVVFVSTRPSAQRLVEPPNFVRLHNNVIGERCDRRTTLQYEEALLDEGQPRKALDDAAEFFGKCGDWYRLRWITYSAHERLGEHQAAADEASKLMAHDPMDHDYPWWRGMALRGDGPARRRAPRLPAGARDPARARSHPVQLSALLEQKGQFCEARQPILQFVKLSPARGTHPNVVERLDRLRILGHCN